MKEPKIRIKGFSGEWKRPLLEECLEISNEVNNQNLYGKNEVLSVSDESGVVNQIKHLGRSYAGKSLSGYKILRPDQIVYTKSPLRQKPFGIIKVNNGETGIVSVLYGIYDAKEGVYPKYIQRYFDPSNRINNYLLPLVNKGAKNTMNISDETALQGTISIPPTQDEQKAICNVLDGIDAQILASTSRLASLKQMKAASLQAMFPQEGETVPKVRFKGFEGVWKKVKLSECLEISTERNLNNKYGVNEVLSVSDEEGVMNQIKLLGRSYAGKSVTNYKILRTNQVVYTKSPLKAKPYGIVKVNKGETGIVSVLYAVYDAKECVSPDYIHYYFEPTFRINNYLLPLINKGAKNTMNISDEVSLQGDIILPNTLEEQLRIVEYLQTLDRQIALHAQLLEKLKQIKAACLDKMFV